MKPRGTPPAFEAVIGAGILRRQWQPCPSARCSAMVSQERTERAGHSPAVPRVQIQWSTDRNETPGAGAVPSTSRWSRCSSVRSSSLGSGCEHRRNRNSSTGSRGTNRRQPLPCLRIHSDWSNALPPWLSAALHQFARWAAPSFLRRACAPPITTRSLGRYRLGNLARTV